MSAETVFLCGGQGSQFFGMGQPLHADHPVFRAELRALDEVARELLGRSVVDAVYSAQRRVTEPLDDLLLSHPAILMVEVALARTLAAQGIRPSFVVGASLGELAALVIAGAVSAEDALRACITQARSLLARCAEGGMVAILDDVAAFHREAWLHEGTWLAAVNFARHFVVSGPSWRCEEIDRRCKEKGVLCQRLPVRRAFHSPMIDASEGDVLRAMGAVPLGRLQVPVYSATQAGWMSEVSPRYFWQVLREPIRFVEALGAVEQLRPGTVVDLSPGGTLGTFLNHHGAGREGKRLACFPIMTPFRADLATLAKLSEHHRARETRAV
ncbi:acyltransferase domain-containing protein [Corallococcus terminator]